MKPIDDDAFYAHATQQAEERRQAARLCAGRSDTVVADDILLLVESGTVPRVHLRALIAVLVHDVRAGEHVQGVFVQGNA